jgi:hypothetical protein
VLVQLIFLGLLVFQIKHFICDFLLQPYAMIAKKGVYMHPWGLLHAALHAVFSIAALLVFTHNGRSIAMLIGVEFLIHYHVDWTKARLDQGFKLSTRDSSYWAIFGADQMLHHITYIGMTYAFVMFPGLR